MVQPEGLPGPGQTGRRESKRDYQKIPLLFVGRVLGKVQLYKERYWRREGRQKRRGTPIASTKFKITDRRKSKIIKEVTVSGWDTPHPPLTSTTNRIG